MSASIPSTRLTPITIKKFFANEKTMEAILLGGQAAQDQTMKRGKP